jgi:methylmalonyl-CoA mutase N-terminal domain/subunit
MHRAIEAGENVMPYLINCAKAYATLGEITDVMRQQLGLYQEPVHI